MTDTSPLSPPSSTKKLLYGIASFLLGIWTFQKVNAISGPAFEPIIEACMNPDIPLEEFASQTGYHIYEPKVGLGVFNLLVCLITQFLLELRQTHPAGLFVWCSTILASTPVGLVGTIEAGRKDSKRFALVRYPVMFGLTAQLFGISVMFPLLWVPSYIFGQGTAAVPLSAFRLKALIPALMPGFILTLLAFTADTESYLWTVASGMLGGPIVALSSCIFWMDQCPPSTKENGRVTVDGIKTALKYLIPFAALVWYVLLFINLGYYGSFGALWNGIWTSAGPSVRFMTIDAGILFAAVVFWVAYHDIKLAVKAAMFSLVVGPGAGPLMVVGDIEEMKLACVEFDMKKKM